MPAACSQECAVPFEFQSISVFTKPFPHFEAENFLHSGLADALLEWFEREAPWQARKLNGYDGYSDLSLQLGDLPSEFDFLLSPESLSVLRTCVGTNFGMAPQGYVRVTAHRLLAGAMLRPHTDIASLRFTHRLLIHLNRGWTRDNGGLLCLFDGDPASKGHRKRKLVLPAHRSAFAFEVSDRSFHAVTRVVAGERYTLSYTFYP